MADHHLLIRATCLLALLPAAVHALEVSPLRVTLPAGQSDTEMWLHNDSDQPWDGQARLFRWQQTLDEELLQPSTTLAVSPAMLTLAPHARQRVRLVRLGPSPSTEQGYRLVLQAGPRQPAVQMSLPVFVAGPDTDSAAGPQLSVRLLDTRGPATLELYNRGTRHARLADLAFVDAQGRARSLLPGLAGYVLAGKTRRWALPGPAHAYRDGRFSARLGDAPAALLELSTASIAPAAAAGL